MKNIFLLVFLAFFIGCEKEPKSNSDLIEFQKKFINL